MKKKIHIMIVDDDPLLRRLFGGYLAKAGYDTIYATNGNDGRETARRLQPDLILMDINMPGLEDGLETAIRMKGEEQTKSIPIIFVTNNDLSFLKEKKLKEIAAMDYIHKSIDGEEFIKRIKKAITLIKKTKKTTE